MTREIKIGLIAAPELPTSYARGFAGELPKLFAEEIDENVSWNVDMRVDPITGSAESTDDILEEAADLRKQHDWDYAICLTDLPIFLEKHIVVSDISNKHGVAQISIPAFGWLVRRWKVRTAVVKIMNELYRPTDEKDERCHSAKQPLEKQLPLTRVKRSALDNGIKEADKRYIVTPQMNGRIRLLLGMAQANRPWSIMSSFRKIIAVAFTTGTFGTIFSTIWTLSHVMSDLRLIILTVAAISLMVIWLIVAHNLWEMPANGRERSLRHLYNQTTLLTLLLSVISYYIVMFLLFFILVVTLVPPEAFVELANLQESFSIIHYVQLAWILASMTTVTGAIGASMEDEEKVRDITYGYRQKRRYEDSVSDDA
ncbi:hypothetical protein [Lentibacillus sediminis]|uniref:hypothetical protein n=1 Tax=Lentibacillus sediminis TaxID=1940529 RepID=UPI000C1B82A5|nr:hypothetical protein [Lentibacillus sediminis]